MSWTDCVAKIDFSLPDIVRIFGKRGSFLAFKAFTSIFLYYNFYSGRAKSSHLCDGWGFFIIFAFEVLYTILMSFPTITNILCRLRWLIWTQKNIFDDFWTILRYFHHSKAILRSELSIVILRPKITKKSKKLKISKKL